MTNPAEPRPNSLKRHAGLKHEEWTMKKDEENALPHYAVLGQSKRTGITPEEMKASIENTYTNPPGFDFMVRGADYLEGNKKAKGAKKSPSMDSAYAIVGVNVFRARHNLEHITSKVQELKDYIAKNTPKDDDPNLPRWMIITWLFKSTFGREHTAVVHLFRREVEFEDGPEKRGFELAFRNFLEGDDKVKSGKLKFSFEIHEAPSALKKTVQMLGGERPVLIGKALKTKFHQGPHYLEVNQDVGSSTVASMLNSAILKASAGIVTSTSWLIEAQEEKELPERLLGVVRWHYIHVNDVLINLDENYRVVNSE